MLPEEEPNKPNSPSINQLIGEKLPCVTSISEIRLRNLGWMPYDKNSYIKDGKIIRYTGAQWVLNGDKFVEHLEDLNQQ